jgi:3-hydroxyisobutyrate dehydrogenase-like beta-hydroxyacid dehydrogenase
MNDIFTTEIVVTMLPDGRVVRAVLLGETGLA